MTNPRYVVALALAAVLLAGCGEKKETLGDATAVFGPGISAKPPPWKPEYAHLKQRIRELHLPPVGKEQFHTHALIHIYNDGLLVPVAANIGIDRAEHAYSSVHTHDTTGIVHMESERPFKFTLGDFFAVWGVRFGSKTLGSLRNDGQKQVHVFVDGKPISNPVKYVMRDKDNIVVAYGTLDSFPHNPSAAALKTVTGKNAKGNCAAGAPGQKGKKKSCIRGG
jgi:hypothetical protein